MKNFKINLFDDKKLNKKYDISIIEEYINYSNIEKLIYSIYNTDKEYINLSYLFYYQELLHLTNSYDYKDTTDDYFKTKYIDEFWCLLSENKLSTLVSFSEEAWEEIKYREIEFDIQEISWKSINSGKEEISYISELSDKDLKVYLNKKSEEVFQELDILWLNQIWFSGLIEPSEELKEEWVYEEFNFIIKINNRKLFIENSIKYLESLNKTEYRISKLKELAIKKIKETDEKFWKDWSNIPIKIKTKSSQITLLILQLEWIIHINKFNILDKKVYVDILNYWINEWIYLNKNNGDVFIDWNKIWSIKINTQDFTFFEFLYNNYWIYKTHKEIKEHIIWTQHINNTNWNFLSVIKRRLDNPIKKLISSPNWWYILKTL